VGEDGGDQAPARKSGAHLSARGKRKSKKTCTTPWLTPAPPLSFSRPALLRRSHPGGFVGRRGNCLLGLAAGGCRFLRLGLDPSRSPRPSSLGSFLGACDGQDPDNCSAWCDLRLDVARRVLLLIAGQAANATVDQDLSTWPDRHGQGHGWASSSYAGTSWRSPWTALVRCGVLAWLQAQRRRPLAVGEFGILLDRPRTQGRPRDRRE